MQQPQPFWDAGAPRRREWDPCGPSPGYGNQATGVPQEILEEQRLRLQMHQNPQRSFFNSQAVKDYGGFPDEQKKTHHRRAKKSASAGAFNLRARFSDAQVLVGSGTVAFLLTLCLYNFGLFRHPKAVCNLTLLALASCALLAWHCSRRRFYLTLSTCCATAVLCGAVAGLYCYDNFGYFSLQFANLRTYENVVPSLSIAVVADAGRITFAKEARLDQARSVGFAAEDGHMYCAAPVVSGLDNEKQVDFWAVGRDCCKLNGHFDCGAASDPTARGGVVVLDGAGGVFSSSDREHYDDARRKSQAVHGLTSPPRIMYLRWATAQQLQGLTNAYDNKAAIFFALATGCYSGIATALAWLLAKGSRRKEFEAVPEI